MSKKVFDSLRRGLKEAIADAKGDKTEIRRRTVCVPAQAGARTRVVAVNRKAPPEPS